MNVDAMIIEEFTYINTSKKGINEIKIQQLDSSYKYALISAHFQLHFTSTKSVLFT